MNKLQYNASGCVDMTAYQAIMALDHEREVERNMSRKYDEKCRRDDYSRKYTSNKDADEERVDKLMSIIFKTCDLAGFHLENRIELKDKKTGKIYK